METKNFLTFLKLLIARHDPYKNDHGTKTAEYARILAKLTDYPERKLPDLDFAAHVHDMGKLLIPEVVLNKKGKLTVEERVMIQRHVPIGHQAIMALQLDPLIADVVLQHHERLDGTGYPAGLRGNEITLEAQIVGICDVYDALTSERSYREALSAEEATKIMKRDKGCFDPKLLDVFLQKVVKR